MKDKSLERLKALSNANGVPGFEDEVLAVLRQYGGELGSFEEDHMRNLVLRRRDNNGKRPLVMLDAHSDEVGFMVQSIKPNGMLGFVALGGWVSSNVPAHRVRVRTQGGVYIPGIVSSKPPHFTSEAERKAAPVLESMAIDVGACSAAEVQELGVRIGAPVVPDVEFGTLANPEMLTGKAFDCRIGCAAALEVLEDLQYADLPCDVAACFAVQEELGLRGARVNAQRVQPDVAIVLEAGPADDTFAGEGAAQNALGKGPMVRHFDPSMLANPRLVRFALQLAEENGIPVQQAVRSSGGTNAGAIHLAGAGVPVVVLSTPVRYIHTHYGIAQKSDYDNTVKLARLLVEALTPEVIAGL